jgi:hypothetical protein
MAVFLNADSVEAAFEYTGKSDYSGRFVEIKARLEQAVGFSIEDDVAHEALFALEQCGLARISYDPYADVYAKIYRNKFKDFVRRVDQQRSDAWAADDFLGDKLLREEPYPDLSVYLKHQVFADFHEFGESWLLAALEGLKRQNDEDQDGKETFIGTEFDLSQFADASDRLVTFSDNQRVEISNKIDAIVNEINESNAVSVELGDDKERISSEVSSGKSLLGASKVRLKALVEILLKPLKFLVEKFSGEAVGELAKQLIHALFEAMK